LVSIARRAPKQRRRKTPAPSTKSRSSSWKKAAIGITARRQTESGIRPAIISRRPLTIEKTPAPEILREERTSSVREDVTALEGLPGDAGDGPEDSSDIYRGLTAETAAINSEFAVKLNNAPPGARRALKDQKKSALAAAKRRAKAAAAGRKRVRKDRRLRPVRRLGQKGLG
jgi:hypothetical protein